MVLYDVDRVRAELERDGAATLLATRPQNVLYLTRFRKAGALAVLTAQDPGRPTLVVPAASIDFVLEDPDPSVDAVAHGAFYRSFASDTLPEREATVRRLHEGMRWGAGQSEVVAEVLKDVSGPVIVDVPPQVISGLEDATRDLDVRVDPDLFLRLRMVKTPEEVERLRTAARITEEAIAESLETVEPGVAQAELAAAYAAAVASRGADIRADNVSIDEGAALGNVNMPDDRVRDGSIVRYDVGAIHRGYASDIARCFSVGPAERRHRDEYEALWRGEQAALDRLRPGVRASQLFETAVAEVRRSGLASYQRTHVGHGMGIAGGYDKPLLAADDETVIEPGMVLCVETPYYDVGRIGLQVEDMVVVTDDGFDFLSRSSRQLEEVR